MSRSMKIENLVVPQWLNKSKLESLIAKDEPDEFDNCVRIYWEYLIDCLRVLKYDKPLPQLRKMQSDIYEVGRSFRTKVYTNPTFVEVVKELYPICCNRGLFNFEDFE